MKNRELKAELIQNGQYEVFCARKWQAFSKGEDIYFADYGNLKSNELTACFQMSDAKRKQRHRVEEWLNFYSDWLKNHKGYSLVFATITWNNESMKLSPVTRKNVVRDLLTRNAIDYVSNIDYGSIGEREHYHAAVILDDEQMNFSSQNTNKRGLTRLYDIPGFKEHRDKYGFICLEPIDLSTTRQVSCYLAKLVNHSLKVKQSRLGIKKSGTPYRTWLKAEKSARTHEKRWNMPKGTWIEPNEETIERAL